MRIHPAIAALRNDRDAQRVMQDEIGHEIADWRSHDHTQAILQDMELFGGGADLCDCAMLDRLMSDHNTAAAFVQIWQRCMIAAMRKYPLGELTFAHQQSEGLMKIVLIASERASLSVIAYEQREVPLLPPTAVFSDRESYEFVLSGSAEGALHEVRQFKGMDTLIDTCTAHWRAGAAIETKGPCETRQVVAVNGAMVLLQLSRSPKRSKATREYTLNGGALVKSASGDKQASQKVMAMAVLGAMQAHSALEGLEQCALEIEADIDARWEAVRQSLAIDAAAGIALLDVIAQRASDPLQVSAQDLRGSLKETQPELSHLLGAAA